MKLTDVRIGIRLGASHGVLLILMVLLTGAGAWLLRNFDSLNERIMHNAVPKERLVTEWRHLNALNATRTALALATGDAAQRAATQAAMRQTSERITEILKELERTVATPKGKALLADILAKRTAYIDVRKALLAAEDAGDQAASTEGNARMQAAFDAYDATLGALAGNERKRASEMEQEIAEANSRGQLLLGVLCTVALVIAAAATVFVTRSITRPLARAVAVARTVAAGDLSSDIDTQAKDETGELLGALREMNASLRAIVGEVRSGADTIATASDEIARGNLDLSSRTEQQAGSLEETASSMEELTSAVRQNAENARQANQLALQASSVAQRGGEVIAGVTTTMSAIRESANRIVDIIGVIDGIAFQTNILALNAAVEAARAGEQGRGFAVVASEVRTLAQRSASAAKEIKALIGTSVENVGAGSRQVEQAGATMDEIVRSVARVNDIMGEITLASREQETGIEQINGAVGEMDTVTQQNAALVEEAAAAAQSLQEQAARLAEAVSVFRLDGAAGGVRRAAGRELRPTQALALA
ncbi:methyl-accepting chemotaxis protein [Massilia sp. IC2-476]|uniref:methyl-accepting chemotaxis protein n=1 Tax=Massilia sp. IC2-476 TaxID=2887199 RepID=UPI0027D9A9E6|nr:methyl-accepting chemotaxis protein [Massilia sp. IC2-476]